MRRLMLAVVMVVGSVAAGVVAGGPDSARACSIATFTGLYAADTVERNAVVAVGTWVESSEREAVFAVDEALKGAEVGERFVVDNRGTYTQMACSPYDEPFHGGYRFSEGERSVLFLEKEVDGLWQVGWLSYAAFPAPADEFAPMRADFGQPEFVAPSLDDVRAVAGEAVVGSGSQELEVALGCGVSPIESERFGQFASLATVVAIVEVVDAMGDAPVVEVREVLAGTVATTTVSVNPRWISDVDSSDGCQPAMSAEGRHMLEGRRYVAFLRPDEFGVGEFRPVAWGRGIVEVNERYLTWGMPTLGQIREATGHPATGAVGAATIAEAEDEAEVEAARETGNDDECGSRAMVGLAALATVVVLGGAFAGWRVMRFAGWRVMRFARRG